MGNGEASMEPPEIPAHVAVQEESGEAAPPCAVSKTNATIVIRIILPRTSRGVGEGEARVVERRQKVGLWIGSSCLLNRPLNRPSRRRDELVLGLHARSDSLLRWRNCPLRV